MESNFTMTGDEARILMTALLSSQASIPVGTALSIYFRLAQISQVQPPSEKV